MAQLESEGKVEIFAVTDLSRNIDDSIQICFTCAKTSAILGVRLEVTLNENCPKATVLQKGLALSYILWPLTLSGKTVRKAEQAVEPHSWTTHVAICWLKVRPGQ